MGRTDTEKTSVARGFGIPEVRPESEILADETVAAPEIAGREHEATVIHDVNGQGTGPGVEAFEVLVDLAHETGIPRAVQQIDHIALKPEGRREIGVLADLALQARGVEFQAMPTGGLQIGHAQMLADPIGRIRRSQGQEGQGQRQNDITK